MAKFALSCTLVAIAIAIVHAAQQQQESPITSTEKTLPKRSLSASLGSWGFPGSFGGAGPWSSGSGSSLPPSLSSNALASWNPWNTYSSRHISAPTPNEVAHAIAAAKQASANVLIAQQQMQAAKENVLNQQRMAMEKETAAAILTQKSEAAAAIQRSEAAAAAQAVVLAQQRLAASKSAVAHQQRIAAAREAEAATALQRSAHAAAAEIQKTEHEAAKFGQFTRNGNAGVAHHLTLTKDVAFSPITAGTNHVPNASALGPWASAGSLLDGSGGAGGKPAAWS